MSSPCGADFDICILELRCSWWYSRQVNYTVGSERENQVYKSVPHISVNPNVPIYFFLQKNIRIPTQNQIINNNNK